MDFLADAQNQIVACNSSSEVASVNSTQQQQLTTQNNEIDIKGGNFSGAHVGPHTYNLTRQGIVGGNFQGANFGAQQIQQTIHNTFVTQTATKECFLTEDESNKDYDGDLIQLSDSIRINKKKPLSRQGNVYYGEQTSDVFGTRALAVKLIPFNEYNIKEAKTLLKLSSHPNVVRIIHSASCEYSLYMYIAMELCEALNLYDHIITNRNGNVVYDVKRGLSWARQVTEAIEHIHKNRILHRDLKPHNILIARGLNILKISDFGLSKELRRGRSVTAQSILRVGTDGYRAPETYNGDVISQQADIFSLGLVIFFIWSNGYHPYGDDPDDWNSNIKRNRNQDLDRMLMEDPESAKSLLTWILKLNPRERPTAAEILRHKTFQSDVNNSEPSACTHSKETSHSGGETTEGSDEDLQTNRDEKAYEKSKISGSAAFDAEEHRDDHEFSTESHTEEAPPQLAGMTPGHSRLFVAEWDYKQQDDDELSFSKGEIFVILHSSCPWWMAKSMISFEIGLVPHNYLSPIRTRKNFGEEQDFSIFDSRLNECRWFFRQISRVRAMRLLRQPGNQCGTFLVRESESRPGERLYSLSVLGDPPSVFHYQINSWHDGKGWKYYISSERSFGSLLQLVQFYSTEAYDLHFKLAVPCPIMHHPKASAQSTTIREHGGIWETDFSSLSFHGSEIAISNDSRCWKGDWNGRKVAIKRSDGGDSREILLHEIEILKKLRHENIITLLAVVLDASVYMITELMSKGNLRDYLRKEKALDLSAQTDIAAQVSSAKAHMEQMQFIHRDLRAENVLVCENRLCKLADFGLARQIPQGEYKGHAGQRFPIRWSAPESISVGTFSIKSDVWSFGILLSEIATRGGIPYAAMGNAEVVKHVKSGYIMPKPNGCPDELYELMKSCWRLESKDRPTFDHLQGLLEDFFVASEVSNKELDKIQ